MQKIYYQELCGFMPKRHLRARGTIDNSVRTSFLRRRMFIVKERRVGRDPVVSQGLDGLHHLVGGECVWWQCQGRYKFGSSTFRADLSLTVGVDLVLVVLEVAQ